MKSNGKAIAKDAKEISKLAGQHPSNPNGFISSLDDFFRNMCMEMVNKKGGVA